MYLLFSERDLFFILLIFNDKRFLIMYTQIIMMHTRGLRILADILWLSILSGSFYILDKSSNDQSSSNILKMPLKYSVVLCMMFRRRADTRRHVSLHGITHELWPRETKNTEERLSVVGPKNSALKPNLLLNLINRLSFTWFEIVHWC